MDNKIGILEPGLPSNSIIKRYGTFSQMFRNYFSPHPELTLSAFNVADDVPVPDPTQCDAWIITGSRAAVYEEHAWLPPLLRFIQTALASYIPLYLEFALAIRRWRKQWEAKSNASDAARPNTALGGKRSPSFVEVSRGTEGMLERWITELLDSIPHVLRSDAVQVLRGQPLSATQVRVDPRDPELFL
jgi:hypothetical protein